MEKTRMELRATQQRMSPCAELLLLWEEWSALGWSERGREMGRGGVVGGAKE